MDNDPKEPGSPQGKRQRRVRISTRLAIGLAGLFLALCTATFVFLMDAMRPPQNAPEPRTPPGAYEEYRDTGFELMAKRADLALLQTLAELGVSRERLSLVKVEQVHADNLDYLFQSVRLEVEKDARAFAELLDRRLAQRNVDAVLKVTGPERIELAVLGRPTHELLLSLPRTVVEEPAPAGGMIAVVIDDLGENLGLAQDLAALPFPVTFAVWPTSTHAAEVARIAVAKDLDLIIHQPMEPLSYPEADPGPEALFTTMNATELTARLTRNLARLSGAIGMNNHMGSRFTADPEGMAVVMAVLKKHGLFFLDSVTTPDTVGREAAAEANLPYYRRQVFLDNVLEVETIAHQLSKAQRLAASSGIALAIGHPHPETVRALSRWYADPNRSATPVRLSRLSPLPPPSS